MRLKQALTFGILGGAVLGCKPTKPPLQHTANSQVENILRPTAVEQAAQLPDTKFNHIRGDILFKNPTISKYTKNTDSPVIAEYYDAPFSPSNINGKPFTFGRCVLQVLVFPNGETLELPILCPAEIEIWNNSNSYTPETENNDTRLFWQRVEALYQQMINGQDISARTEADLIYYYLLAQKEITAAVIHTCKKARFE